MLKKLNNLKILIIGSGIEYGIAKSYQRAFKELLIKVSIFDEEKRYRSFVGAGNKYLHRLFWRILALPLQKKIIKEVYKNNPDIIFVFKGWLIKPSTLDRIKKFFPEITLFNFNPDNPFNTWHHGNSNSWIRKSIPFYDCYFIWGKFLIDKLYKAGAQNIEYLPFGYDPKLHHPAEVSTKEKDYYGSDVSFIGSWDKEREEWLSHLLDYDLKIWGNHWEKAKKEIKEKWTGQEVISEEYSKVCSASKVNLNFIRKQNKNAHNMRTFEIPSCGGFMLSNRTLEQSQFFKEGEDAEYFASPSELKEKIDYYLSNPKERKKIKENGYKKLKKDNGSYKKRAKKVLDVYRDIKQK